ncbi:MAG TPA: tRNA (adenosine(37)-N6)-threonylcarbamoyltransferase complex dimerization subunit type 1 TsaB, partial [Bacteroidales bacterium]|nr:tRNA (adenosine(37)-N6)-threonylcarbamoyltransferase complex dimerization subunit type 1 TsaB [Bacteroidales bacterium]
LSIPLIAAGTLEIMAAGYLALNRKNITGTHTLLCPMIDARRMEVYTQLFNPEMKQVRDVHADIVDENSYADLLRQNNIIFFGDGAEKCRDVLTHDNAIIDTGYTISAAHMAGITFDRFNRKQFEDVAYFEPFYLKDFIATIPKNKIF